VIESFKQQLDRVAFAHMGFLPQNLGKSLPDFLIQRSPEGLDHVYFVSGGSEAVGQSLILQPRSTGFSILISNWVMMLAKICESLLVAQISSTNMLMTLMPPTLTA